ncbi:MAG: hypothetical protein KDK39_05890 [Leptospiraceae bacterium]|nr:hypothetical protein [Leptospiraceae bacterium]
MNKKSVFLVVAMVAGLSLAACGKDKPDPGKFAEVCSDVAKCDVNKTNPMLNPESCTKMLAGIEEKMGDKVNVIVDCIKAQSCEQKDMMGCMQKSAGMMLP